MKPAGKELGHEEVEVQEEQIAFALKQAETGTPVAEVIRPMGVSEQTFYRSKKVYGGLGVSERRSCLALGVDRSSVRYVSHKPDQAPLRLRIHDLAAARVRCGYFRIYILLRREGWLVNHMA